MELNLRPGFRYLFHTKENIEKEDFRATVIDVLCNENSNYKTLRLEKFIYENGVKLNSLMVTMPYDWIETAKTIEDILGKNLKDVILPSEILLEIDSMY